MFDNDIVFTTRQVFGLTFGLCMILLSYMSYNIESRKFNRKLKSMKDIKHIMNSDDIEDYKQASLFLRVIIGILIGFIALIISIR